MHTTGFVQAMWIDSNASPLHYEFLPRFKSGGMGIGLSAESNSGRPPVDGIPGNQRFSNFGGNVSRYGVSGTQDECAAFEMLTNIDRTLRVMCSLLENLSVALGVEAKVS
jgi:hypothetical protein